MNVIDAISALRRGECRQVQIRGIKYGRADEYMIPTDMLLSDKWEIVREPVVVSGWINVWPNEAISHTLYPNKDAARINGGADIYGRFPKQVQVTAEFSTGGEICVS